MDRSRISSLQKTKILAGDSSERDVRHSSIHTQSPLPFWYIVGPSNHWFQDDNQRLKPGPSKIVETPTRGAIADAPCIPNNCNCGNLWNIVGPPYFECPSSRALTQVLPCSEASVSNLSQISMIVGPERSYWILHHDHWNEEALRTFLLRKKRELVSVWQSLKKEG